MSKQFKADLHIHTCLSPCAELQMTPSAIVKTASKMGIDIIAITDHNSAENLIAAKKAAEKTGLTVLPGMEVTSVEEAHILAIFDDLKSVMKLQEVVYENLLQGENPPFDKGAGLSLPLSIATESGEFGNQIVVNEKDEVLGFNKRLLIAATTLSLHSIVDIIHSLGGLSIASHVDREVFGIISQLGFIPPDLKLDAIEISPNTLREQAKKIFDEYIHIPWITSSDAHYLKDIGKRTTNFFIKEPTITEMASALKNIDSRKVEWE